MSASWKMSLDSEIPRSQIPECEFHFGYLELIRAIDAGQWDRVLSTLEGISKVGEKNGRREISIQAQSLRATIECRTRHSKSVPFAELANSFESLIQSLKRQLNHLVWTKEVSASQEMS